VLGRLNAGAPKCWGAEVLGRPGTGAPKCWGAKVLGRRSAGAAKCWGAYTQCLSALVMAVPSKCLGASLSGRLTAAARGHWDAYVLERTNVRISIGMHNFLGTEMFWAHSFWDDQRNPDS
jgi:hypothetical protein